MSGDIMDHMDSEEYQGAIRRVRAFVNAVNETTGRKIVANIIIDGQANIPLNVDDLQIILEDC